MSEPEVSKKRKGGAEKVRIKKQIMLKNEAKNCSNILNMFSKSKDKSNIIRSISTMNDTDQDILCSTETELTGNVDKNVTEIDTPICTILESSSTPSNYNYFQKPITTKLFTDQLSKKKSEVTKNLNIVERVIDVIKLIGKRGLSFRGHLNECSRSLKDPAIDHGNFLDILLLLKKYDKSIAKDVRESGMFSIQLDTTQDISVQDQCSVVVRYVNSKGIQERLLSVVTIQKSTGKSFADMLANILTENDLDVKKCVGNATDGAANMQGQFNGFSAWLEKLSPNQVHIWCYAHILNLVVIESTKSPLNAAALFVTLNDVAIFFKESYKRMNIWVNIMETNDKRRLQAIGNTRWWSKEKALTHIFGDEGLYFEVILALNTIENLNEFTPEANPLSKYLQTKGMDLLKCQGMVSGAITNLKQIQRDFNGVKKISKKFIDIMSEKLEQSQIADDVDIENELPSIRSRKRKALDGEETYDNQIMNSETKYMIEVHNVIMDNTITSIEKKFLGNKKMYTDFACLSPSYFEDLQKNNLPATALYELTSKIKPFEQTITTDGLKSELLSFSRNWSNLKKSIPETYEAYKNVESDDGDLFDNEISTEKSHCKTCMNCAICCYSVLQKYNLYCNAYSNLALAYKYLLTLPCSQVACERSFSFLKCIKTRLRSTLSENKLEAFMLMGIEKDILYEIDNHEVIELLKSKSTLLKNKLSY
ncbi:uncharacterized protein LOC112600743 [Melanaphis sacchari]|uniref:uncharacterized protein LOC112600743 n=1 Tax=Melanaphis sacchari TaxID=742174 RepID=UPI000DC148F1|nr:uncharacterized protein LOC112600743 [Melanaphis sacchari]